MLKFLKELFGFGSKDVVEAVPYKVEAPTLVAAADVVEQPTSVQADPVAVALDLEPMDFAAATTPLADKKPRKPRAPKTAEATPAKKAAVKKPAAIKAPAKRGPKKAK